MTTWMPSSDSTGTAGMNGSDTITAFASIMVMTAAVSWAHRCRSVRGVG